MPSSVGAPAYGSDILRLRVGVPQQRRRADIQFREKILPLECTYLYFAMRRYALYALRSRFI